jgi:hypothetical protein
MRTWSESRLAYAMAVALALFALSLRAQAEEPPAPRSPGSSAATTATPDGVEIEAVPLGHQPPAHAGALSPDAQSSVAAGVKIRLKGRKRPQAGPEVRSSSAGSGSGPTRR